MRVAGAPESAIAERLESTEREWNEIRANPVPDKEWASDGKLARNTYLWWSSALDCAVYRPLLQVDVPILAFQGSQDSSMVPGTGQGLAQHFVRAGRTNFELRVYEGEHVPPASVLTDGLNWLAAKL